MSKKKADSDSKDDVIDAEILEEGEYVPQAKQAKKYYKAASEYREANSFSHLFGGLMDLLSEEDAEEMAEIVDERRSNRRYRLKQTILEHEAQAGDIQEAEATLTAIKAHLVSLDPEYESMLAAYERQSEAAYKRGKRQVKEGFDLAELGKSSNDRYDDPTDDPWDDDSTGADIYGIQF